MDRNLLPRRGAERAPVPEELSAADARRAALAAQGFGRLRLGERGGRVDRRHFRAVLGRLGCVQIDSVNVVTRAHELTFFARLGPYDPAALARWLHRSGEVFEYWGHAASFLPVELQPALRFRMAAAARGQTWRGIAGMIRNHPEYLREVLDAVRERGPLQPADLHDGDGPRRTGPWWGWDAPKRALEALFWCGEVTARRDSHFARLYDLPARVLPADVLGAPTPSVEASRRTLLRRAAAALGVASAGDLADYFRLPLAATRATVAAMAADGELVPVRVQGWREPAYLAPGARVPARLRARALLAPFDSLVWDRRRVERVFGFSYRVEIYTPAPKRVHGYYVLPFLLGDRLVARVDLKADRPARRLLVRAAWAEPGTDHDAVAGELDAELRLLAGWLGLDAVDVTGGGDLAPALAAVSPSPPRGRTA
jgi:uncharacterized protein YcaQ